MLLTLLNAVSTAVVKELEAPKEINVTKLDQLISKLIDMSISAGKHLLAAFLIYLVGSFLIKCINKLVAKMLQRRRVDVGVQSFLRSLINILLTVLLIVSIIGALGVNTTSFAALLASAGVAVGMALSGNLQNFAGGLIVLLFKPFRVGDWVESNGVTGCVREIQIFHTILNTYDNKIVYIPNGTLSNSIVINYTTQNKRRVEWSVGIEYGENVEKVRQKIIQLLALDKRILHEPEAKEPFVAIDDFADSSVNIVIKAWTKTDDYWEVLYDGRQQIYDIFNKEGINIPFPQRVVHMEK